MTTAQRPGMTVDINLTDEAVEQVKNFMDAEQVSVQTAGLRVSVLPGGCAGFKYGLNIEEQPLDDDIVVKHGDLRLFVDAFSAQYLQGTTIDFVSNMNGSGFTFNNPSATGGCGCGSSFSA
jgi:iron-sulfur cluster assembly accessory protein